MTALDATMTALAARVAAVAAEWLPALVDATLKGTLLLAVAGAATTWGMRRAAAATRHLVWSAAVVAVLALPLLGRVVPGWTAEVVPPALTRAAAALREPAPTPVAPSPPAPLAERLTTPIAPSVAPAPLAPPALAASDLAASEFAVSELAPSELAVPELAVPAASPWLLAAFGVWAAGVLIVLLRLALGTFGLARLVRRAQPADDPAWVMPLQRLARDLGIRRPVSLYVGRTGTVPVTWGVVYPVVLLPADAAEWSEERRRAVLLHELAHVERLDALTQVLSQLATALFWFNPLVVLAGRRLRAERERACDDLVLAAGGVPATRYADDLLDLVRTLGEASPAAAALAMARRSEFEGRLLAILDPAAPRARTDRRRALVAAALVGLAAVPLAGMRPALATDAVPSATTPDAAAAPVAEVPSMVGAPSDEPEEVAPARVGPPAPLAARVAVLDTATRSLRAANAGARTETVAGPKTAGLKTAGACSTAEDARVDWIWRTASSTTCLELRRKGAVAFTPDYLEVRAVSEGGVLVVLETRDGVTRRMEVATENGRLVRRYTVDGRERPAAEGEAWFRATLRETVRRAGLDAETRVAAVRAGADVDATLADVRRTTSDGAKRRLLLALLERDTLSADALQRVAVAARGIVSDGDKAAVLEAVARAEARTAAVASAVIGASRGIVSDGDRRRVLERAAVPDLPPAVVADLLRAVSGMTSDGDKSAILIRLAPRVGEAPAVRAAFFGAVRGFTSDGDRRRVLVAAVAAAADDSVLAGVLAATGAMVSEGDRVEVLKAVAAKRRMESAAVRERYFKSVGGMVSESARETALLAALRAEPSCKDTQLGVIAAATKFVSDAKRAAVLLEVARTTDALRDPAGRAAYLDALRGLTSSSEYRRVMEAVVP